MVPEGCISVYSAALVLIRKNLTKSNNRDGSTITLKRRSPDVTNFVRLKSNVLGSQIHNLRDIKTKQHLKDRSITRRPLEQDRDNGRVKSPSRDLRCSGFGFLFVSRRQHTPDPLPAVHIPPVHLLVRQAVQPASPPVTASQGLQLGQRCLCRGRDTADQVDGHLGGNSRTLRLIQQGRGEVHL